MTNCGSRYLAITGVRSHSVMLQDSVIPWLVGQMLWRRKQIADPWQKVIFVHRSSTKGSGVGSKRGWQEWVCKLHCKTVQPCCTTAHRQVEPQQPPAGTVEIDVQAKWHLGNVPTLTLLETQFDVTCSCIVQLLNYRIIKVNTCFSWTLIAPWGADYGAVRTADSNKL